MGYVLGSGGNDGWSEEVCGRTDNNILTPATGDGLFT